ncbi:MAG TPA: type II toxin-antitoxin system HicA family toxin, partial [Candidatus Paceibacterota bacterium]
IKMCLGSHRLSAPHSLVCAYRFSHRPPSMPKLGVVHWKKFEKFLLASGCEVVREEGDHRIYQKKGIKRPIVIPRDTLPPFIVLNNLRTLDVSRDEYLKILRRS